MDRNLQKAWSKQNLTDQMHNQEDRRHLAMLMEKKTETTKRGPGQSGIMSESIHRYRQEPPVIMNIQRSVK